MGRIKKVFLIVIVLLGLALIVFIYLSPSKTEYYSNGNIKAQYELIFGEVHGEYIAYHQNGNIKEIISYDQGIQNGISKFYYENGTLRQLLRYENGELIDTVRIYHPTGSIKEIRIVDTGKYWLFFENGQIEEEGQKVNDKFVGLLKTYDESGKLRGMTLFDNGKEELISHYTDTIGFYDYENSISLTFSKEWYVDYSMRDESIAIGADILNSGISMLVSISSYELGLVKPLEILQRDFAAPNFSNIAGYELLSIEKDFDLNGRIFYSVESKSIINDKDYRIYSFALFESNEYYVLTFYSPIDEFGDRVEEFKEIGSSLKFIVKDIQV